MISTQNTSASLQSFQGFSALAPVYSKQPPPPPPTRVLRFEQFFNPPPSPSVYSNSPPIRQGTQEYCPYCYFSLGNITLVMLSQKKIIMDKTTYFRLSFKFHLLDIRTTYTFANINCFWTVKVNAHVIMETDSDVQRKSLSSKKFWN